PAQRLHDARQDHARCLRLAAWYRRRLSCGERAMRERHDWALGQARRLRFRFPGQLSGEVA
ncbi:hypothetical protein, partial [Methylobacterium sp. J-076]|uniref:hypothetical protein n=1 Tax=Methylobacterium sp. J-076 TaxID=2836655 RepID=UPI001FBBF6B9